MDEWHQLALEEVGQDSLSRLRWQTPEGIEIKAAKNSISVSGVNKELVGEVAAKIRSFRPPEPYKGKGIRYVGEYVRIKKGKTVGE